MTRRISPKIHTLVLISAALCAVFLAVNGNHIAFLFLAVFFMLLVGMPVALALAGASLLWVFLTGKVPDLVVVHRMVNGVDSFRCWPFRSSSLPVR